MNKLLFVHGTKFKKDEKGRLYTGGSYNEDVWKRYTVLNERINVIARLESQIYSTEFAEKKFNVFPGNYSFFEAPDIGKSISGFFKQLKIIDLIIREKCIESNLIIIRLPSLFGYVAIKNAKKFNKPYIVEVVGCPWDAFWNHSIKGKIVAFPIYLIQKYLVKNAPYVMYVTNEFLQKRYPSHGVTIGCSDVIIKDATSNILKNRLKRIDDSFRNHRLILGTVAAVDVRFKGQQFVFHALKKLKRMGIIFEYRLIGGGNFKYLADLSKKLGVDSQVKFLGALPHSMVLEELDSIDIYLQPSKQEGLPRALIEAMSRGCLAIGSNAGGIPELLDERFITRKGDFRRIAALLRKINKSMLVEQAEFNIRKSRSYQMKQIENKRKDYYTFIKNQIQL